MDPIATLQDDKKNARGISRGHLSTFVKRGLTP